MVLHDIMGELWIMWLAFPDALDSAVIVRLIALPGESTFQFKFQVELFVNEEVDVLVVYPFLGASETLGLELFEPGFGAMGRRSLRRDSVPSDWAL